MSKLNNGDFYFGISDSKIHICFFETGKNNIKQSVDFDIPDSLNNNLNFKIILNLLRANIRKLEKSLGSFLNQGNISIHSKTNQNIFFCIKTIFDKKKLDNGIIANLVQSGIQYFNNYEKNLRIVHVIINKYIIDDISYDLLPENVTSKKIILEIEIVCLDKNLINKIQNLFKECKINLNKIVSFKYAKQFLNKEKDPTMCISAKRVIDGVNKSEVVIRHDNSRKIGIFDKIFYLFD